MSEAQKLVEAGFNTSATIMMQCYSEKENEPASIVLMLSIICFVSARLLREV
jgi:hypothetical protein